MSNTSINKHFISDFIDLELFYNIIMHKLNKSKRQSTSNSSIMAPLRKLLPPTTRRSTQRSLNDSIVSTKSVGHIKLPSSFYNDHSRIYQRKSRILSQSKLSFQSKPITFSQRKRFQSSHTQNIVQKRRLQQALDNGQSSERKFPHTQRSYSQNRFKQVVASKFKKLMYGKEVMNVQKNILDRSIKRSLNGNTKKWHSPFMEKEESKSKLLGKQLFPKKIDRMYGNEDPTQLKVLNLDRLFRQKGGKLMSVIPLPIVKVSEVTARGNLINVLKGRDMIHEVIGEYNSLIRLMNLKKTAPKLGVKGKQFTKSPTIQELMGIKINPSKEAYYQQGQLLSQQIFLGHCKFYQRHIKKDIHLSRRIISGLTQQSHGKGLSLAAFAFFHQIFASQLASSEQKANFLTYFFLPEGQQTIQLSVFRLILEHMCQQLPKIEKLQVQTDLLSNQQKSKIFLEALSRVLFGDLQKLQSSKELKRSVLKRVFYSNPDACDLLIQILQVE